MNGTIDRCQRFGPGSIPGQRIFFIRNSAVLGLYSLWGDSQRTAAVKRTLDAARDFTNNLVDAGVAPGVPVARNTHTVQSAVWGISDPKTQVHNAAVGAVLSLLEKPRYDLNPWLRVHLYGKKGSPGPRAASTPLLKVCKHIYDTMSALPVYSVVKDKEGGLRRSLVDTKNLAQHMPANLCAVVSAWGAFAPKDPDARDATLDITKGQFPHLPQVEAVTQHIRSTGCRASLGTRRCMAYHEMMMGVGQGHKSDLTFMYYGGHESIRAVKTLASATTNLTTQLSVVQMVRARKITMKALVDRPGSNKKHQNYLRCEHCGEPNTLHHNLLGCEERQDTAAVALLRAKHFLSRNNMSLSRLQAEQRKAAALAERLRTAMLPLRSDVSDAMRAILGRPQTCPVEYARNIATAAGETDYDHFLSMKWKNAESYERQKNYLARRSDRCSVRDLEVMLSPEFMSLHMVQQYQLSSKLLAESYHDDPTVMLSNLRTKLPDDDAVLGTLFYPRGDLPTQMSWLTIATFLTDEQFHPRCAQFDDNIELGEGDGKQSSSPAVQQASSVSGAVQGAATG